MAKPNYQYEKRQKDLAKQRKKQEKEQEKALRKASKVGPETSAETPDPSDGAAAAAPVAVDNTQESPA